MPEFDFKKSYSEQNSCLHMGPPNAHYRVMEFFAAFFTSGCIVTLLVIAIELLTAPVGYEDDNGFHTGSFRR